MNNVKAISLTILLFGPVLFACDKDEVHRREAEAISSFEGNWTFVDAEFFYEENGLLSIRFHHKNDSFNIIHEVLLINIEPTEGSTNLTYRDISSNLPTSLTSVTVGGDVFGDIYIIDSTATTESSLTIDCIANNKITGKFQVNYIREFGGESPYGLPEKFSLTEGKFDARR